MVSMEQLIEFAGNHVVLSLAFIGVLGAWIVYEMSRLARKWREVDTLEAVRLINRDDTVVIDASNSSDYAKGHIIGAIHLPPSRIESGNQQLNKMSDKPVLLYCKNGQISPQMANRLVGLGFSQVHVLSGGLTQWVGDNQPIARSKGSGKSKDRAGSKRRKDRAA